MHVCQKLLLRLDFIKAGGYFSAWKERGNGNGKGRMNGYTRRWRKGKESRMRRRGWEGMGIVSERYILFTSKCDQVNGRNILATFMPSDIDLASNSSSECEELTVIQCGIKCMWH